VAALAVAAGARRPWWPWAHLIAATAFSGYFVWVWSTIVAPDPNFSLSILRQLYFVVAALAPVLVMALVGSSWTLISAALRKGIQRPVALVVAVNALNLTDAVLTRFAVASGGALELNPFVRVLGLPVKLAAVAGLTVLLYKRRAPALVWPVAVLLWVLCYHISGMVVNG
jgi:hypothetical protein